MGVAGHRHALGALRPGKETRHPLYRRLGWPQDRSGEVRNISKPPGFDQRTIHSVASRYDSNAMLARINLVLRILQNIHRQCNFGKTNFDIFTSQAISFTVICNSINKMDISLKSWTQSSTIGYFQLVLSLVPVQKLSNPCLGSAAWAYKLPERYFHFNFLF
jgi:hypothetical protein